MCRVHAAVDIFDCMRGLMVQTYLYFDPMAVETLALLLLSTHTMAKLPPSPHIFPLLPKITSRSPRFGFGEVLRGSISSYFDPFYDTKLSPAPSFARRTHTMSPIFFIFGTLNFERTSMFQLIRLNYLTIAPPKCGFIDIMCHP